jgi:hypothetical protein
VADYAGTGIQPFAVKLTHGGTVSVFNRGDELVRAAKRTPYEILSFHDTRREAHVAARSWRKQLGGARRCRMK